MGQVQRELGNLKDALQSPVKAVELAPEEEPSQTVLGHIYRDLGRYEQAVTAYKRAIVFSRLFSFDLHMWLADAYLLLERYKLAIATYKWAIPHRSDSARPHRGLGLAYSLLGNKDKARVAYQQALELDDSHRYVSMLGLARIERQAENQAQATALVDQVRPLLPPDDFYNLACLESIAGNADAAVEALRRALEHARADVKWAQKDPDFVFIRNDSRYRAMVGP